MNIQCSHCGQCCLSETCELGQAIFKSLNYCPALIVEDGLYYCGLIWDTAKYIFPLVGNETWKAQVFSEFFKKVLGIGRGCSNEVKTPQDDVPKLSFEQIWGEILKEYPPSCLSRD